MHNGHDERTRAVLEHAKRKAETHTKEVTRETISPELQTLMLEMADTIAGLNRRVAELQTKVDAIGSVTLNDMIRKTA
jgi:beta-phosphoglucomutase-like phosphatase (HAD superfamily)